MLEAVFSFQGRLNRLQYFLGCLALGMAIGVMAVVLILGFVHSADPEALKQALLPLVLFVLVGLPLFFWISFSLQARRIRDIGWNPLYVIPGWILVGVVDFMLAKAIPALAIGKLHNQTVLGGLINLALSCALLFWPGRAEDDGFSLHDDEAWSQPDEPSPVMTPAPVHSAPAAYGARPAGAGFGRRGL
ncbi:MAG TPA: DUF805 domain-containing protein [Caulobacteraceae bacterium]